LKKISITGIADIISVHTDISLIIRNKK